MGKSDFVQLENVRDVEGMRVSLVRDSLWLATSAVRTRVPTGKFLFNFNVHTSNGRTLLVLDPYGDETLPDDIRKELGVAQMSSTTVGIWRDTGQIVHVSFAREKKKVTLCYWSHLDPDSFTVPGNFLPRLDNLMSMKRPYSRDLTSHAWRSLHTRRIGYDHIAEFLVYSLNFGGDIGFLEVSKDSYRTVSGWNDV